MNRPRAGLLFTAGLVLAALVLFFALKGGETGKAARPPAGGSPVAAMRVPVTQVLRKTVPVYLDYVGTTDAIRSVTLQAQVTGYLLKAAVPDGAEVSKGELLYQIDPRSYQAALDQATAQAQKDTAALEYAKANRHRNYSLSKTGDVSIDALQQATSTEDQYRAALAADHAAIETAQLNLGYTEIRAPFAGRLSLAQVHEGALITNAGTVLNTLVQLDPIYATFNPPDTDLPEIEKYQAKGPIPAEVIVGTGAAARTYQGKLTFLDNTVGRSTGTITTRATIENPDHTLLPGQFVHVRLHITDKPDTLLVPQAAVGSSQLGKYLFVIGKDNRIEQHYVTLGADYGTLVAVNKGVADGQRVVTGKLLQVGPGMQVNPVEAASSPQAGPGRGHG
jgi:membrane fusion protein, multidrug efflux system